MTTRRYLKIGGGPKTRRWHSIDSLQPVIKQITWIKVKVFMKSFHDSLHGKYMSMMVQLDSQVAVYSCDTLQEVNTEVYQVRCGLCAEKFESYCSNLLDELKHVCHMTLVQIDIVWWFKSSYGYNKFVTNFQLPIPALQITLPVKSVFGNLHYVFTIPENMMIEGTNQNILSQYVIIYILVKSKSEVPQYYSQFQAK